VRPFRVPLGGFHIGRAWIGYIPALAMLLCLAMILPVIIDIVMQALDDNPLPALILELYLLTGVMLYVLYGSNRSALARESPAA
jgi:basic amino acid/polyamine antiporter, APA family